MQRKLASAQQIAGYAVAQRRDRTCRGILTLSNSAKTCDRSFHRLRLLRPSLCLGGGRGGAWMATTPPSPPSATSNCRVSASDDTPHASPAFPTKR